MAYGTFNSCVGNAIYKLFWKQIEQNGKDIGKNTWRSRF
jgi:hypothetical protein